MKRLCIVLLALMLTQPAHAIVPVIDEVQAVIAQNELIQTLKSYVLQTKSFIQDAQQLAQVMTMAESMIAHPSLYQAEALLAYSGIGDPLAGLPVYSVMALTSGYGSGAGLSGIMARAGQLGGIVNSMSTVNRVYDCQDQSFACAQQQQRARAAAGYQGVIGKIYNDLTARLNVTNALRADLATSTDPSQREAIIASLQAESNWATTAIGQLNAASAAYHAQKDADANRDDELLSANASALSDRLKREGY